MHSQIFYLKDNEVDHYNMSFTNFKVLYEEFGLFSLNIFPLKIDYYEKSANPSVYKNKYILEKKYIQKFLICKVMLQVYNM